MRQITEFLQYKGGEIRPHVLYSGTCKFELTGKLQFQVFGSAKLNGNTIKDTTITTQIESGVLVLGKDSAIVFHKLPPRQKIVTGYEPVPDIPEPEDQVHASILQMVEEILYSKGYRPTGEDQSEDPDDYDDDDEYLLGQISDVTLLETKARDADIYENDVDRQDDSIDSDLQQATKIQSTDENKGENDEVTGMREAVPPPAQELNSTS